MTYTVGRTLTEMGISNWELEGNPSTEAEFNSSFRKVVSTDANGSHTFSNDPSDFGVTWSQIVAKQTELNNAEPMRLLREERDRRLAETDWWAGSDHTMTQAQTDYRQALRDITDNATSLDDVTWPTKP